MKRRVISAQVRPHREVGCWCNPGVCECCGGPAHRVPEVLPDIQERMASFSDMLSTVPV